MLFNTLQTYFNSLETEQISEYRKSVLQELVIYIKAQNEQEIKLTFICTHNSRRSHLGQVWAKVAAYFYGFKYVETFSGGTETTACNERTIAAFERAGLHFTKTAESLNPVYEIRFAENEPAILAFSKIFDESPNPNTHFAAIMTCDHAEQHCPYIAGADARISIKYKDPKESDNKPQESETYDERCRQIATEMKWVFEQLRFH